MEPQQQQQQNEDGSNKSSSSFQCRQSTTRWTPTTEQIRILKDLYYNNGVRSPSAEQIQKISAKLRQYGKIEGKNVFYWFQNHKARERQKKRLTTTTENIIPMQRPLWRPEDPPIFNTKSPSFNSSGAVPSPSAASSVHGLNGLNQFGNYGYGSLAMEKSFRDCSISPGANGGSMVHNFMWGGVHQDHPYPFLDKKRGYDFEVFEDEQEDQLELDDEVPELETLPLFPMHDDDDDQENVSRGFCNNMKKQSETENYYYMTSSNCYHHQSAAHHDTTTNMGCCSRASLELTLNSYGGCSSSNAP